MKRRWPRRPPRRIRKADFIRAEQLLARFDALRPEQRRWLEAHTNRVLTRHYWFRDVTKSRNVNWRDHTPAGTELVAELLTDIRSLLADDMP